MGACPGPLLPADLITQQSHLNDFAGALAADRSGSSTVGGAPDTCTYSLRAVQ